MKILMSKLLLSAGLAILLAGCGPDPRTSAATQPTIVTVINPAGQPQLATATAEPTWTPVVWTATPPPATPAPTQTAVVIVSTVAPTATVAPTVVASPTPGPTVIVPTAPPAPAGQATQFGPYNGEGFVADCISGCAGAKVQVWYPNGVATYGTKEIHTIVPPGKKISFPNAGGTYWVYPVGHNLQQMETEMALDSVRRANQANYFGMVPLQQLVDAGLAVVQ